ncbi:MAG TPA: hypothetical protein VLA89_17340, partial [Gemmatimonadales bacterium]|nr:hypothetical protein [Gemmatimonadales bacterium]
MHAAAVAGRGRVAAVLTILVGGTAPLVPPLAVVTPHGPSALVDLPRGEAARNAAWRPGPPGLDWTEIELQGRGEARKTRVVVARLDPTKFRLALENGMAPGGFLHVWTLDLAPPEATLALNAGMFEGDGAWGWVVHEGTEYRVPRTGSLARAVVIDSSGAVRILDDEAVKVIRASRTDRAVGAVREAFQSYPALLDHGELPAMLTYEGASTAPTTIDLQHRDA